MHFLVLQWIFMHINFHYIPMVYNASLSYIMPTFAMIPLTASNASMFRCTNNKQYYFKLNKAACTRANLIKTSNDRRSLWLSSIHSFFSSFLPEHIQLKFMCTHFFFNQCNHRHQLWNSTNRCFQNITRKFNGFDKFLHIFEIFQRTTCLNTQKV